MLKILSYDKKKPFLHINEETLAFSHLRMFSNDKHDMCSVSERLNSVVILKE